MYSYVEEFFVEKFNVDDDSWLNYSAKNTETM